MNHDFPRILTLLRKERGLSQKEAAAELGISERTIYRKLADKKKNGK